MGAEPDSANGLLHALLPRGGGGSARAPLLDLDWAAAGAVDLTGRGGGGGAGAGAGGGGAATELDSMFDQLMQGLLVVQAYGTGRRWYADFAAKLDAVAGQAGDDGEAAAAQAKMMMEQLELTRMAGPVDECM